MNAEWLRLLRETAQHGRRAAPRGKPILERDHVTFQVDMDFPVLTVHERRLSYRGMAAEAYWIISGSDRLDEIALWLPRMREFSDDGATLWGAYGPRFAAQLPHVVDVLTRDRESRQASISLWRPEVRARVEPTRDVPCTLAVDFKVRDDLIHAHVFMRSSDVWLGVPYDVFSFTMMACRVAGCLNRQPHDPRVRLGTLYLTAASSHLYEENLEAAKSLRQPDAFNMLSASRPPPVPTEFYTNTDLLSRLARLRDTKRGDPARWWE